MAREREGERKAGAVHPQLTSSIGSATSMFSYVEFLFVTRFVITATAAQVQMTLSYKHTAHIHSCSTTAANCQCGASVSNE